MKNEKRAIKFGRAQVRIFTPNFLKFRAFGMLQLPKQHASLKVLTENKCFISLKGQVPHAKSD